MAVTGPMARWSRRRSRSGYVRNRIDSRSPDDRWIRDVKTGIQETGCSLVFRDAEVKLGRDVLMGQYAALDVGGI